MGEDGAASDRASLCESRERKEEEIRDREDDERAVLPDDQSKLDLNQKYYSLVCVHCLRAPPEER